MNLVPPALPSGDSPSTVQQYYNYLQAHQETQYRPDTWHVRWLDLAWLWGFVIALAVILLWWVWQYRTTTASGATQRSWRVRRRASSSC
jgi:ABC-type uncharacterized transport system permease subunit